MRLSPLDSDAYRDSKMVKSVQEFHGGTETLLRK